MPVAKCRYTLEHMQSCWGEPLGSGYYVRVPHVVVACPDLMTASRFSAENVDVTVGRTDAQALEHVERGATTCLVDLAAFPDLPRQLRELHGGTVRIVGFAPHVQMDVLEAGKEFCDLVVPRGAAVKRFAALAEGSGTGE